jgi:glycosyltransferase involved in cell wall biosynthesis
MEMENKQNINICAVIPAYNEEKTIGSVISETRTYIRVIYVVNNSSTDNTAEVAKKSGAEVINCFTERGYGAAQYAGQQHALQQGFDYILQLDADGQHDPKYIPILINTILEGDYDIVIGSRILSGCYKNWSFIRKAGILFYSFIVSLLGRTKVTDCFSGFKIYKTASLAKLNRPSDVHPAIEQTLEMANKGMKIKEIPIVMPLRNNGESYFSFKRFVAFPARAIWLILKVLLRK